MLGEGQVLAAFQGGFHALDGRGCPGTIFDKGHAPFLEAALGKVSQELAHIREDACVVGGGGQHQRVVAEGVLHTFIDVIAGQVVQGDFWNTRVLQLLRQKLGGFFCMAVDGGVADAHAVALRQIARPGVIQADVVAKILIQDGAVQRADDLDVQGCGFL